MASSARQIGGVEGSKSDSATTYTVKYFVPEAELASYLPEIGDDASWAPGPCGVTSFQKSWLGPGCWILSISAQPYDGSFTTRRQELDDYVDKRYTVGEMTLPPEWFGARFATPADSCQFKPDGTLAPGERRYLNVDDAWCSPGDAIFCNAVPYELAPDGTVKTAKSSASKGSASYAKSPFTASTASISTSLVNQSVKTRIYECTFHTKRLARNICEFSGVSGAFAADCRPADHSAGRWKALDQTVESLREGDGTEWTRVSRKMILAPLSLTWDPDKNGGTWKW